MEHSKEFYIQQFLQQNYVKPIQLRTIATIIRLYKNIKKKHCDAAHSKLLSDFTSFVDNYYNNEYGIVSFSRTDASSLPPNIEEPSDSFQHINKQELSFTTQTTIVKLIRLQLGH